jgi:hypothetical protein
VVAVNVESSGISSLAELEKRAILHAITTLNGDKLEAAQGARNRQNHSLSQAEGIRLDGLIRISHTHWVLVVVEGVRVVLGDASGGKSW